MLSVVIMRPFLESFRTIVKGFRFSCLGVIKAQRLVSMTSA